MVRSLDFICLWIFSLDLHQMDSYPPALPTPRAIMGTPANLSVVAPRRRPLRFSGVPAIVSHPLLGLTR